MFLDTTPDDALTVTPMTEAELPAWRERADASARAWLDLQGFKAAPGSLCVLPDAGGRPARVLAGMAPDGWIWSLAGLPGALATGACVMDGSASVAEARLAALGFALATYRFTRYGKSPRQHCALVLPDGVSRTDVEDDFAAVALVRDLINTAADDMMPEHLESAARAVAGRSDATVEVTVGDALLRDGFPAIHAVGRASAHAPRLIDLRWGDPGAPRVTLVGKGVCFDSGGLDIKAAAGMRNMKKDMGGAAHALALGQRIMAAGLNVRLRVLIPAVENAIAGNAFHPGDVLSTRAGKTVEIDNTDAEGRLVLCDALAAACEEKPEVLLDFATLTGAARVALGTELPAMFANNDALADALLAAGRGTADPMWRMPLHAPYRAQLESTVADLVNSASGGFGGAITAALYLQAFVADDVPWAHFDLMAWNVKAQPGRPEGGEAMGLRACFDHLAQRFGRS